jgi:choline-sulfatase
MSTSPAQSDAAAGPAPGPAGDPEGATHRHDPDAGGGATHRHDPDGGATHRPDPEGGATHRHDPDAGGGATHGHDPDRGATDRHDPAPEGGATHRRPAGRIVVGAALAGAAGGALAGVLDGAWSWTALGQFLGAAGKLRLIVYLAAAYAAVGAVGGTAVAATLLFYARATRLGDLAAFAARAHRETRARDPRDALAGLSLVLAGVPTLVATLAAAFAIALPRLAERRHPGLVIASSMGAALAALAVTAAIAIAVARPVEIGLRRLVARAPALASPLAPPIAAAILVALGAAVLALRAWDTLRLLPLRGPVVALAIAALGAALAGPTIRADRLARRRIVLVAPLLLVAILVAGAPGSIIKAATAYSGLGGAVARPLRALGDLDRDGYSRWLGGGDCDDGDRHTHPGAPEIPDDGIDQNCVGGDATIARVSDAAFAALPAAVPPDLNIVLVTIDTLRADHLGAYGYPRPTSPSLDALAADGALFTSGWAHAPSTRYSIPAILTGRLPLDVDYDTGVAGWPGLSPRATTIAEILQSRGFATGAILNYDYFAPQRRMNQGFDEYDNDNARLHRGVPGEGPAHTRGSSSREQTDKAIAFVTRHAAGRFFLWVHYYDPHFEYEAHPGLPSFGTAPVDLYDQEIRYTDQHIGRLVDELRARGLYDRTAVVVTGDHGEGFGEHGIDLHGYHLYAAQTKVPFIVRVPGVPPRRSDTPVGHVDILPTLANLAGAPPSPAMMGRSLVDLIAGGADLDRVVFQQLSYEGNQEHRGAIDRRCHVLYHVSPHTSWEAYRIDRDPREEHDLADDPGPCAATRTALERWYDASLIPAGAAAALLPSPPSITRPLDLDLGPEVRLLAVDVPATAKAGDTVDVTWTFAARGTPPDGWKVFAHFESPGGRFTGDHAPVRPFAWWRAGQFIRYTTPVSIPRSAGAGRYALWTGLWKGAKRRPARAPSVPVVDDRAHVADIEVTR